MSVAVTKPIGREHLPSGAAAFGALAAPDVGGLAKVAETAATGPSPVGAWMLAAESNGSKSIDRFAFTKDGLVIEALLQSRGMPAYTDYPCTGPRFRRVIVNR